MAELGKIQKPSADDYIGKKKLYCVANIFAVGEADDAYKKLLRKYWDEVAQQIEKIEAAGKVNKIFCELISEGDAEELKFLSLMTDRLVEIITRKKEEGGKLIPIEDKEILGPHTDWGNCLKVVFTNEVFTKVLEFYTELAKKRLDHMMDVITANLSENEAGLLILKDQDRAKLRFPEDIEVFLITPPSFDDLKRWVRDQYTGINGQDLDPDSEDSQEGASG